MINIIYENVFDVQLLNYLCSQYLYIDKYLFTVNFLSCGCHKLPSTIFPSPFGCKTSFFLLLVSKLIVFYLSTTTRGTLHKTFLRITQSPPPPSCCNIPDHLHRCVILIVLKWLYIHALILVLKINATNPF